MKKEKNNHLSPFWRLFAATSMIGLALTLWGVANAAEVTLFTETFETDGDNVDGDGRYIALNQQFKDDDVGEFFDRAIPRSNVLYEICCGKMEGDWAWVINDMNQIGVATPPEVFPPDGLTNDEGVLTWVNPIDISGMRNLTLRFVAAEGRPEEEPDAQMLFQYRIDGGDWITPGGFRGTHQQSPMSFFTTYETIAPKTLRKMPIKVISRTLVPSFREFDIPIYDTGNSLELRFYGTSSGNHEFGSVDNIRLLAYDDLASMTGATDKSTYVEGTDSSGTLTINLGAAAPAGGVTVTIDLDSVAWQDDSDNTQVSMPSSAVIAEGMSQAVVNFDVLADGRFGGDEEIRVLLSAAGYGRSQSFFTYQNVDPVPDLVINEVYANISGGFQNSALPEDLPFHDTNNDGLADRDDDEFIEIVNAGSTEVDISGFEVFIGPSDQGPVHKFPAGTVLPAEEALVLFGGGDAQGNYGGSIIQYSSVSVLNLRTSENIWITRGTGEVTRILLTSETAGTATSAVRNPDITGDFVALGTVAGGVTPWSPGTKNDGSPFIGSSGALQLTFPAETVAEDGSIVGTVSVANAAPAGGWTVDLSVTGREELHLSRSEQGDAGRENPPKLTVPAQVTISGGATSAEFTATGITDGLLNGDRIMEVHARSGKDLTPVVTRITVTDANAALDTFNIVVNEANASITFSGLDANKNGEPEEFLEDTFIEIVNGGDTDVDLTGWRLLTWRVTEPAHSTLAHVFQGTIIPSLGSVVIWGGSDLAGEREAQRAELQARAETDFGGATMLIANIGSQGANLQFEDGQRIMIQNPYGYIEDDVEYPVDDADDQQSFTRAPDVTGDYAFLHFAASGLAFLNFSPGLQVNGTPFPGNDFIETGDVFGGQDIPNFPGWKASPWYLNYNAASYPWIFHDEHGWQFVADSSTSDVIFVWDLGLENWLFLNASTYRWEFLFSDNPGWIFTFDDNTPERRFFQRLDDGSLFSVPADLPVN